MKCLVAVLIDLIVPYILLAQFSENIGSLNFDTTSENCQVIFDTSTTNIWQIGTPDKPFFGDAYSIPHAILTDTINSYPIGNHSSFTLKFANNADNTEEWNFTSISFWHKFQTDSLHDFGKIYWSPDNSNIWFPMTDTCCIVVPQYYLDSWDFFEWNPVLLDNSHKNFVTGSQDWTYSSYEWNWYYPVAQRDDPFFPDTIYVRFDFDSDSTLEQMDGWMIDDIKIEKAVWAGVNELSYIHSNLKTYPNPATTTLYFTLEGNDHPIRASLSNSVGKNVKSFSLNSNQNHFDVSALPRGVYFLLIETIEGNRKVARIVLQ